MTHLILCGLPAAGKTSVGKELAASLQWAFIDTDILIETTYAQGALSCREIYLKEGSTSFRALEKRLISQLNPSTPTVIACGGGTFEEPETVDHLKRLGRILYLRVPLDILWDRICRRGIPAYLNAEDPQSHFYSLARDRIPLYEKAADVTIDTKSPYLQLFLEGVIHGQQRIRHPF